MTIRTIDLGFKEGIAFSRMFLSLMSLSITANGNKEHLLVSIIRLSCCHVTDACGMAAAKSPSGREIRLYAVLLPKPSTRISVVKGWVKEKQVVPRLAFSCENRGNLQPISKHKRYTSYPPLPKTRNSAIFQSSCPLFLEFEMICGAVAINPQSIS